jgi:hypothetical protein
VGPVAWVGVGFLGLAGVTLSLLVLSWSVHRHESEWWERTYAEQRRRDAEFRQEVREQRRWVAGRAFDDPAHFEQGFPQPLPIPGAEGEHATAPRYEDPQAAPGRRGTLLEIPQGWLIGTVSSVVVGVILIAIGNVWK